MWEDNGGERDTEREMEGGGSRALWMGFSGRIPLCVLWLLLCALSQRPAAAVRKVGTLLSPAAFLPPLLESDSLSLSLSYLQSYVVYLGGHSLSGEEASLVRTEEVAAAHRQFLGSFLGG